MRVKTGVVRRRKHKKILKLTKGYWMSRSKQIKKAKEALLHAGEYAFAGRKDKKNDFRRLWIIRLNAALRENDMKYSKFINLLKKNNIALDRKILSYIAVKQPKVFNLILKQVQNLKN